MPRARVAALIARLDPSTGVCSLRCPAPLNPRSDSRSHHTTRHHSMSGRLRPLPCLKPPSITGHPQTRACTLLHHAPFLSTAGLHRVHPISERSSIRRIDGTLILRSNTTGAPHNDLSGNRNFSFSFDKLHEGRALPSLDHCTTYNACPRSSYVSLPPERLLRATMASAHGLTQPLPLYPTLLHAHSSEPPHTRFIYPRDPRKVRCTKNSRESAGPPLVPIP